MIHPNRRFSGTCNSCVTPLNGSWNEAKEESLRRQRVTRPRTLAEDVTPGLLARAYEFLVLHFKDLQPEFASDWTPVQLVEYYLDLS